MSLLFCISPVSNVQANNFDNFSNSLKDFGKQSIRMSLLNFSEFNSSQPQVNYFIECEEGTTANLCCAYWDVTYTVSFGIFISVECETGGKFKCEDCPEDDPVKDEPG